MDNQRFDALLRRLTMLFSRREGVRVLLAGLGAGVVAATANDAAAHCKGDGQLCRHGGECCSRACRNWKHLKKKNGERTRQKIGRCGCSTFQQQCHVTSDCCDFLLACGDTGCEDHPVCCKPAGAACEDDCDCCGDNVCGADSGRCEAQFCSDTQEPCDFTSECCNDDEICDFVAIECGLPVPQKVCCGTAGSECGEDCDCCFPFECDEGLEECVAPASTCPPNKVICTSPNRIKDCCDEDFAECCDQGSAAGCCQTGFPVCCAEPHEETGAGCCPEGFQCCPPTAVVPCCPEDQFCCPGGDVFCADTPDGCDPV